MNAGAQSAEPASLSLADFFIGETSDPLTPPEGFSEWRRATTWATALYEPALLGAPEPRCRVVVGGREHAVINLASYNYLGLARHPEVIAAIQEAVARYGSGACGSPMLSGKSDLHFELERRLSEFLGREATLLFNSGFGGAMGCLAGLLRRGDAVFSDAGAHLSLADGAQLFRAKAETFAHNDLAALEAALERTPAHRRLVVVEGIYSMEGDTADLAQVCALAERHGASVFVDEAHSTLACGARGRGMCEEQAVEERVGLYYGTFSKAFAGVGGFVSGREETIEYLRCYTHSYGFSCALPPATVAGLLAALDVATRDDTRRRRLAENAAHFRAGLQSLGLDIGTSTSHVVPIIIGGNRTRLYEIGYALLGRGLWLVPVDYPAVPQDRIRFRASVTAAHTREDLDEALGILADVMAGAPTQAMMTEEFEALMRRARKHLLWSPLASTREVHFGRAEIERILPHRGRSLLVDEITAIDFDQGCGRATRRLAADDPAFEGHFPGDPLYPGALQLELAGQAGGCLLDFLHRKSLSIAAQATPRKMRAVKVHHALFLAEARPGDVLTVLTKALVTDELTSIFAGQIVRGETICTVAIMEVYFVEL